METYIVLVMAAAVVFLGFIGELVFRKTNVPDVIWLILFGIIIGPVLNIVSPDILGSIAPLFITFTLIFILFEGALNMNIKEMFKGMYGGSLLALVNFVMSVLVTFCIAYLFGLGAVPSLLLGIVLGGTSSAVVIPIVRRLRLGKSASTSLVLESAISDVLCIIALVTIIQVIELGQLHVAEMLNGILSSFVLALFIGGVSGYIWSRLLSKINSYTKSFIITIAFMLLVYGFTEFISSNGAIACFAFGVIIGNSRKIMSLMGKDTKGSMKRSQLFFYSEISFVVKSFFFVYLGILLQFSDMMPYLIAGAVMAGLFLTRPASTLTLFRKTSDKDRAVIDSLVPKGLAAAVLAQFPIRAGIPGTEGFSDIALSAILISIVASTVLIWLSQKDAWPGFTRIYLRLLGKH